MTVREAPTLHQMQRRLQAKVEALGALTVSREASDEELSE